MKPATAGLLDASLSDCQNRDNKRDSRKKKKRKRTELVQPIPVAERGKMEIAESGRQWWEVSGGLYGLGKNRRH